MGATRCGASTRAGSSGTGLRTRTITPISRTVGETQVVDELIISFTHDCEMPALLPGVAPTGRKVVIPFVVVVGFKGGKIDFERIYWDQASMLAQLGLLDKSKLPVTGAEQAARLLDPSLPSNTLIPKALELRALLRGLRGLRFGARRASLLAAVRFGLSCIAGGSGAAAAVAAESAPAMGDDAGAPAERHPIEPPDLRRHGEIDEQQHQHHRHIGEEVNGEAARALRSMKMRSRRRVLRKRSARAWVATAAPQPMSTQGNQSVLRGEPEIDRRQDQPWRRQRPRDGRGRCASTDL